MKKKVTIISDGLVKEEYFLDKLDKISALNDIEVNTYSWYEDLDKGKFQEKINYIEKNGPEFYKPPKELLDLLRETNYLFLHIAPVNKEMLSVCQNLELIGLCRGGTENIDLEYCKELNIPVIRTVKNADAVAEFTLGLILSMARNISHGYYAIRNSKWQKNYFNDGFRKSIAEMKIGLIGLGEIGNKLSQILISLGAKVYGYHPNITEEKKKGLPNEIELTSLEYIFSKCDVISLHLRMNEENQGIINKNLLGLIKDSSILINTARAGLINKEDLFQMINDRPKVGVALDVFWNEPVNFSQRFIDKPNVLLTPHIAGDTNVISKAPELLFDEINKYLNNEFTSMLIKDKYMKNVK